MGAVTYPLLQAARQRGWCKFVDADPRDFHASLLNQRGSNPGLPELAGDTASPYYLSSAQVRGLQSPLVAGEWVLHPLMPKSGLVAGIGAEPLGTVLVDYGESCEIKEGLGHNGDVGSTVA